MFNTHDSGTGGSGLSPGLGRCVVFKIGEDTLPLPLKLTYSLYSN